MKKTFYEVCTFDIELHKTDERNGKSFKDIYNDDTNTTPSTSKRFETFEAAQTYYEQQGYNVPDIAKDMGNYWLGELRYIEVNTYEIDDDGDEEWIAGGDWYICDFPTLPNS